MGQALQTFTLRATLKTPVIMRGYLTLDALLMAELVTGDVSHLLKRDAQLYYASAAFLVDPLEEKQKASFVASMRPTLLQPSSGMPPAMPSRSGRLCKTSHLLAKSDQRATAKSTHGR